MHSPRFISLLLMKLVRDRMFSLLRCDCSEQLAPVDSVWDQNDWHKPYNFNCTLTDLGLNWDCGVSTGDGRFVGFQNHWTSLKYFARFRAACCQVNTQGHAGW
jgi:hypothetical protein